MSVQELENKKQYDDLISKTPTVIILAHANYAAPSRAFRSDFRDLAGEKSVDNKVVFAYFDAFDAEDINADLMVRTFPAYFIFKDGKQVKATYSANATKQQLAADVAEFGR